MDIYCDMCNHRMKFIEKIKSNKPYRIKRYECPCGYTKTIFGSGCVDELEEDNAIDDVNKMYKQQSNNN